LKKEEKRKKVVDQEADWLGTDNKLSQVTSLMLGIRKMFFFLNTQASFKASSTIGGHRHLEN
jgi:hypothetical protein